MSKEQNCAKSNIKKKKKQNKDIQNRIAKLHVKICKQNFVTVFNQRSMTDTQRHFEILSAIAVRLTFANRPFRCCRTAIFKVLAHTAAHTDTRTLAQCTCTHDHIHALYIYAYFMWWSDCEKRLSNFLACEDDRESYTGDKQQKKK